MRSQRSRNSQLKLQLWQASQKQRNLLSLLNSLLAGQCCPLQGRWDGWDDWHPAVNVWDQGVGSFFVLQWIKNNVFCIAH